MWKLQLRHKKNISMILEEDNKLVNYWSSTMFVEQPAGYTVSVETLKYITKVRKFWT